MTRRFGVALSVLIVVGCGGGVPSDIRERIATFQQNANAGRLAEIRRTYPEWAKGSDYEMAQRAALGRMISTTEGSVEMASGSIRTALGYPCTPSSPANG